MYRFFERKGQFPDSFQFLYRYQHVPYSEVAKIPLWKNPLEKYKEIDPVVVARSMCHEKNLEFAKDEERRKGMEQHAVKYWKLSGQDAEDFTKKLAVLSESEVRDAKKYLAYCNEKKRYEDDGRGMHRTDIVVNALRKENKNIFGKKEWVNPAKHLNDWAPDYVAAFTLARLYKTRCNYSYARRIFESNGLKKETVDAFLWYYDLMNERDCVKAESFGKKYGTVEEKEKYDRLRHEKLKELADVKAEKVVEFLDGVEVKGEKVFFKKIEEKKEHFGNGVDMYFGMFKKDGVEEKMINSGALSFDDLNLLAVREGKKTGRDSSEFERYALRMAEPGVEETVGSDGVKFTYGYDKESIERWYENFGVDLRPDVVVKKENKVDEKAWDEIFRQSDLCVRKPVASEARQPGARKEEKRRARAAG